MKYISMVLVLLVSISASIKADLGGFVQDVFGGAADVASGAVNTAENVAADVVDPYPYYDRAYYTEELVPEPGDMALETGTGEIIPVMPVDGALVPVPASVDAVPMEPIVPVPVEEAGGY